MACIDKIKEVRRKQWRVRIRRKGLDLVKYFRNGAEAEKWAQKVERALDKGEPVAPLLEKPEEKECPYCGHSLKE